MQASSNWKKLNVGRLFYLGTLLFAVFAVKLLPPGAWRLLPALLLLVLLPLISWINLFPGPIKFIDRLCLTVGWLSAVQSLLLLILHYLPGFIPADLWLGCLVVLSLLPFLWGSRANLLLFEQTSLEQTSLEQTSLKIRALWTNQTVRHCILILFVSLAFRGPWLGYKEFQGDEAIVMVRAADAIVGDDAELFLHQKGPLEILAPLGLWVLTGRITEGWARVPFLLANLCSIVTLYALGRRWFDARTGLWAGLLLSLVGFHIGFGRIVQYQSFVVLFALLSLLATDYYYHYSARKSGGERPVWLLPLAALLLAVGLLAHYDAVLFLPAIVWLVISLAWQEKRVDRTAWLGAVGGGSLTLLLFYLPFLLNPNFAGTFSYLLNERVGTESTGEVGAVWRMLTFYNSTYFIIGVLLLALLGLIPLFFDPEYRSARGRAVSGALLCLTFVPLLFYTLIVTDPRTHIYTFFPGLVLLAGLGISQIERCLSDTSIGLQLARLGLGSWLLVSGWYVWLMFTFAPAEIQRNWETARPVGYWTSWEAPPQFGLFGFPYQAGWRSMGHYLDTLGQPFLYGSNEEQEVTMWYTGQAPRTHCSHYDLFLRAEEVQDAVPYDENRVAAMQTLWIGMVDTVPKLELLAEDNGRFRPEIPLLQTADGDSLWQAPHEVARPTTGGTFPADLRFGDQARLIGYDLDLSDATPGGEAIVTLYWEGLRPIDTQLSGLCAAL